MSVKITQAGIDKVQNNSITSFNVKKDSISTDDLPSGCCIQTVSSLYTPSGSLAIGTSDTAMPGSSLSITAKGNNSKFLIRYRFNGEIQYAWNTVFNIQKNGVRINNSSTTNATGISMAAQSYAYPAANYDSTPESCHFWTLDESGSVKGQTYTFVVVVACSDANTTLYYNRTPNAAHERSTMEIQIFEIKG